MEFLANENFPYPSILFLRDRGYSVTSISETYPGICDEEVLSLAVIKNLIILTFDKDYGELIFKYNAEAPPAIIFFRTKGITPVDTGKILIEKIEKEKLQFDNFFTVIEKTGIRQRKLR